MSFLYTDQQNHSPLEECLQTHSALTGPIMYTLGWREAIMVKCFAQEHKHHDNNKLKKTHFAFEKEPARFET